jgi:hypothetical protein
MKLPIDEIFLPTSRQVGTGSGPFSRRGDIVECDARAICSSTYDLKKGNVLVICFFVK